MIGVRKQSCIIVLFIEVLAEQSFIHVLVWTCMTVQISLGWGTKVHHKRAIPLVHVYIDNTKVCVNTCHCIRCSAFFLPPPLCD